MGEDREAVLYPSPPRTLPLAPPQDLRPREPKEGGAAGEKRNQTAKETQMAEEMEMVAEEVSQAAGA